MKSGVYKILCKHTGKIYVGSSKNMKARFAVHKCDLKRGKHGNPHMKEMYSKYGLENFSFFIIEKCDPNYLKEKEQFWIDKLNSFDNSIGFNIHRFSVHKKSIGEMWKRDEYKEMMSQKAKDRWKDPVYREKHLRLLKENQKKQIQKYGCLAINTSSSKEKARKSCSTPEFLKGLSERASEQLKDENNRKIALENLEKGRRKPEWKENLKKAKKKDSYKKKISESIKKWHSLNKGLINVE